MTKITPRQIEMMIKFREDGLSYREISYKMCESEALIYYHVKKSREDLENI